MTAPTVAGDSDNGWRDDAACLERPAEWFTGPHAPGDARRAIDVCNTCPVKRPCLNAALEIEVSADLGIWGGTTPTTRRWLRREAARQHLGHDARPRLAATQSYMGRAPTRSNRLEVFQDEHGDHVDRTGRVIIFELHGHPPYMLMIDGKPRARTSTVGDAAGLAARLLMAEEPNLSSTSIRRQNHGR